MNETNTNKKIDSIIFQAVTERSLIYQCRNLSILFFMVVISAIFSSSAVADSILNYLPHAPGDQWSYLSNNGGTRTATFGSPVKLPNGVFVIPATVVDSNSSGNFTTYSTIDSNGFRRHQEYQSSVYVEGYGNTSLTAVYSPAIVFSPAEVSIGSTYTSSGSAVFTYTNVSTYNLNYATSTKVIATETVSDNSGQKSWTAIKISISITISGTVNGQFFTNTIVHTLWLVEGLGTVKSYIPNSSQVMETWKLTSTNVNPSPTIATVAPISGPLTGATPITITGTNLTGATSVTVGGVAATSVVATATSITAKTPVGTAGAKDILVTTAGGTVTKSAAFTFVEAPTIVSVSPASGPLTPGTPITIAGTNFIAGATVKVGGVAATSVVVVSPTSITAITPVSVVGAKDVAVTTVGGTATKTGGFTYVALPTIATVAPINGPLTGATTITITGANFVAVATVKVGGVAATSVVVVSATSITAVTPAGVVGAKDVAVTTVGGIVTKTGGFTYVALPTIATVAPSVGPLAGGTSITITGTNFIAGATTVKIGGTFATSVVATATSITAKTPLGTVGAKDVAVTTVGGTATKAGGFTYTAGFTGDETTPGADGNSSGGAVASKTGNDTSAGQSANTADIESAAPMGIALYLQTVSQHADAQVACDDASNATDETVSEFVGRSMSEQVSESNNALVETSVAITVDDANSVAGIIAAIDLDHNGEPDICQLRGGDLDLNGVIDERDMAILLNMINTQPVLGIGDMDSNGEIDAADMSVILLQMQ